MKKIFLLLIILFTVILTCVLNYRTENIALIGAMDCEVAEYLSHMKNPVSINQDKIMITKGKLGKHNIILSKSGIGKVNAAMTTQYIIDKYKPKYIINTGLAGALDEKLSPGDIIIAENMIQHDTKNAYEQHKKWKNSEPIDTQKPSVYSSNQALIELYKNKLNQNNNVYLGTIVTGDVFVEDKGRKEELKNNFDAIGVDMESSAIAQVADKNSIPVIVIRTICDSISETEKEYSEKEEDYARKSALSIISVLSDEK